MEHRRGARAARHRPGCHRRGPDGARGSRGVIPPEHVFPLINADYAGKATRTALARLNSSLTTDQLAALASAVTGGESPAQAAAAWLRAEGLVH
ncbi:glycine betaine ABC transporter substrate-binding protein [Kitasatospora cathayae]|uniref:glycine betaine ABC transporter substrate-binding protein n=1 Tax=Kitasatospora cathayae TaxID=3004092 RepID=UPI002FD7CA7C